MAPVQATQIRCDRAGSVYSMTNDPSGNEVVVCSRDAKGSLDLEVTFSLKREVAGKVGQGDGPFDLDTTVDGRFLYVLKAGAGTVGMFRITPLGTLIKLGEVEGPLKIYAQGMVAR